MNRRRFLASIASATTLGLAGCLDALSGGGGVASPTETAEPTDTPEPMDTPTETATVEATPTEVEAATPTEGSMGTPTATAAGEAAQVVTVGPGGDFSFDPRQVTVAVGETVRWEWDSTGHNVKPSGIPDGSDWSGTPGNRSETYGSGYTYSHTFEVAGTYAYVCVPHESLGMTGTVVVEE